MKIYKCFVTLILVIASLLLVNAEGLNLHQPLFSEQLSMTLPLNPELGNSFESPTSIIQDNWFGIDKFQHLILSAGISIWTFQYLYIHRQKSFDNSRDLALGITISLGLTKEIVDSKKINNHFSYKDLVYDLAGAALAYIFYIKDQEHDH